MASTPSWLIEECPTWCVREHREEDIGEDRCHHSLPTVFKAEVATEDSVPMTASIQSIDLAVWAGCYVGEPSVWLVVEPLEQRFPWLVLSAESATTLAVEMMLQVSGLSS